MSAKLLPALPLWLCLSGVAFGTPNDPTLLTPSAAGVTTYNTRPWVKFTTLDSAHLVNRAIVSIYTGAGTCDTGSTVEDSCSNPPTCINATTFSGLQTTGDTLGGTVTVLHRLIATLTPATYSVCVRVGCSGGATLSAWSSPRSFTIVTPGGTDFPTISHENKIRTAHFSELRAIIDNIRVYWGVGGYAWTDSPLTAQMKVRIPHMTQLRAALVEPYTTATGTNIEIQPVVSTYTFTDAITNQTKIRAIHINELRSFIGIP